MTNIRLNPKETFKLSLLLQQYPDRTIEIEEDNKNGIGRALILKVDSYDATGRECTIVYNLTDYSSW